MHPQSVARITNISRRVNMARSPSPTTRCDVFINHRGIDTKRNVAGLLYQHLCRHGLCPFLDKRSLRPGDKLFDKINVAIRECKVGIAIFSPLYCDSYFCLHELSTMMEMRKKVIPIFCNVKPSELAVRDDGSQPEEELERFRAALKEAKYTVGLTFDSLRDDWPEFLARATDAVMKILTEEEDGEGAAASRFNRKYQCQGFRSSSSRL